MGIAGLSGRIGSDGATSGATRRAENVAPPQAITAGVRTALCRTAATLDRVGVLHRIETLPIYLPEGLLWAASAQLLPRRERAGGIAACGRP